VEASPSKLNSIEPSSAIASPLNPRANKLGEKRAAFFNCSGTRQSDDCRFSSFIEHIEMGIMLRHRDSDHTGQDNGRSGWPSAIAGYCCACLNKPD